MKRTWTGIIRTIRKHYHPLYEGNTLIGGGFLVRVDVLISDGPQAGRSLEVWVTSQEAEEMAQRLLSAAQDAREAERAL